MNAACPDCGRTMRPNVLGRHRSSAHDQELLERRFWSHVDRRGPDDCWEWTGTRLRSGYGVLSVQGAKLRAPRVSYELALGPIPDGLWVLHRCDNPPCVNPLHLFLGSHADNMADMTAKGRRWSASGDLNPARLHPDRLARGARNGRHTVPGRTKLVAADIPVIRRRLKAGESQRAIAADYGIARSVIGDIGAGRKWGHVA